MPTKTVMVSLSKTSLVLDLNQVGGPMAKKKVEEKEEERKKKRTPIKMVSTKERTGWSRKG